MRIRNVVGFVIGEASKARSLVHTSSWHFNPSNILAISSLLNSTVNSLIPAKVMDIFLRI